MSGFSPPAVGQLPGTITNDSANAGNVGEILTANLLRSANTAITTATPATVTSKSLTPGDWDVSGTVGFSLGATLTSYQCGISSVAASIPGFDTAQVAQQNGMAMTGENQIHTPIVRVSLSATTTYYLTTQAAFSGAATIYGTIRARRVR